MKRYIYFKNQQVLLQSSIVIWFQQQNLSFQIFLQFLWSLLCADFVIARELYTTSLHPNTLWSTPRLPSNSSSDSYVSIFTIIMLLFLECFDSAN